MDTQSLSFFIVFHSYSRFLFLSLLSFSQSLPPPLSLAFNHYLQQNIKQWGIQHYDRFRVVVVITCASHAQGPRFDPERKQQQLILEEFYFPCLTETAGDAAVTWIAASTSEDDPPSGIRTSGATEMLEDACCYWMITRLVGCPIFSVYYFFLLQRPQFSVINVRSHSKCPVRIPTSAFQVPTIPTPT